MWVERINAQDSETLFSWLPKVEIWIVEATESSQVRNMEISACAYIGAVLLKEVQSDGDVLPSSHCHRVIPSDA